MDEEPQFLYLTTIGRKTGLPREIEIWFTHLDSRYYLIAELCERAHWVRNILENPRVTFRISGCNHSGTGRILDRLNEQALWQSVRALSERKYGWGDGLIVEVKPEIPSC